MRIRAFNKVIDQASVHHILNDSTVVIDGQNFFYDLYQRSGLQFTFGCESDKYADYLRDYLSRFKQANVKCYFIFKGGEEDITNKLIKIKMRKDCFDGADSEVNAEYEGIVLPIFMKEVYKQVLDEMDFDYVTCELEAKRECIAFAQKHKCSIMSYDIEFSFSGVPYIPYDTLNFVEDQNNNQVDCKLFILDNFLRRDSLNKEKLAIFIVLTDERVFPEDNFLDLTNWLTRFSVSLYKRNLVILNWLSKTSRHQALHYIFKFNEKDKEKFLKEEIRVMQLICRQETPGVPTEYLENGNNIQIMEKDPLWFEKGVALQHVSIQHVNLYRYALVFYSWAIEDQMAEDSLLLSTHIIKYAYDLLTNFKHPEITFVNKKNKNHTPISVITKKPSYEADNSVFENGWSRIRSLKLFEHFLIETLQGFRFDILEKLPEDARLLMIALVYFSHKKSVDTSSEVYSVLLSYVTMSIVFERKDKNNNQKANLSKKPVLDSTTNKDTINQNDKMTAAAILEGYFDTVSNEEAKAIFDPKLIHPLVQFQHILQQLNFLNKLCGAPYSPTVYSKTYNGTFVYKILYEINKDHAGNGLKFVVDKLNPAATVLAFMNGLVEAYGDFVLGKCM